MSTVQRAESKTPPVAAAAATMATAASSPAVVCDYNRKPLPLRGETVLQARLSVRLGLVDRAGIFAAVNASQIMTLALSLSSFYFSSCLDRWV